MLVSVAFATAVMIGLAVVFSVVLCVANVKLAVEVDPRQEAIEKILPQANCGGCGFASCSSYAQAVVEGTARVDLCTVGGPSVAAKIGEILGVEVQQSFPSRPIIHCGARTEDRLKRGNYTGEPSCAAADVVGGVQGCVYGCLGFGDCVNACTYGAMRLKDGLPEIDYEKCIGCGACARACPRGLIEMIPFKNERMLVVACASQDPPKVVREVCKVGCIGCKACARLQPDFFVVENNVARLNYDNYSPELDPERDFAPVLDKCPREALVILGKPPRAAQDSEAEELETVGYSGRPKAPERPTVEDMDWRG